MHKMKEVFYNVQCFAVSSLSVSLSAQSGLSISKNLPLKYEINVLLSLCSTGQGHSASPEIRKTLGKE